MIELNLKVASRSNQTYEFSLLIRINVDFCVYRLYLVIMGLVSVVCKEGWNNSSERIYYLNHSTPVSSFHDQ